MRRFDVWGVTLVLGALLPSACGQVLGLKDFKDQSSDAQGGTDAASGGAAGSAKGGASAAQNGGSTATSGGSADAGSAGSDMLGSGGNAPGSGGSPAGNGGASPGSGGALPGSGGNVAQEGGAAGASNGTGGTGGSTGGTQLNCTPDAQIIDLMGPPELDVPGSQSDVDEESLVVVGDSGRLHVGIQRTDGQYVARSLSDGGGSQQPALLVWTKSPGDNHRFTRGRVRLGKLEFYGMVRDSIAVLQVPINSQGIAPGPSNSAVVETLVRKPCPSDASPTSFGVSFHGADYSLAVTCESQSLRSLQVFESGESKVTEIDSGDPSDSTLRVQDYVYVPGAPLIQVGDGGTAMMRLGVSGVGMSSAPFSLDFGTGLAALFGITENANQTGALVLAASLANPGLVPAHVLWANVSSDKYSDMAIPDPPGFSEVGVFRSVAEVGEPGRPSAGDWGLWMVGHSKSDTNVTTQTPQVMRGTWIGPQGATLVFNQTLHTTQGPEVLRRAYAVRVGLAATFVVWLENVPDPSDATDPNTPKLHRLRAQRFTCAAAP